MFRVHAGLTDAKAKALVRQTIFKHGCAKCLTCQVRRRLKTLADGRYFCGQCRKKYSLKQLAGFEGSKLNWSQIVVLGRAFIKNYTLESARDAGAVTYPTVRHFYDLMREKAAKYTEDRTSFLNGVVVIDGCYIGKRRNHNQAVVLGVVQKDYRNIAFRIVPEEDQGSVEKFLYDTTTPWSHVIHDGHAAYADLSWTGVTHETEIHELGQLKKTCPIERIWALLRTRIRRTYHHVWKEKLPDYLAEFRFKFLYRSTGKNQQEFLNFLTLPAPTA